MINREILFGPSLDPTLSYRIPVLHAAPDGTHFAFCEARRGSGGDWDPMCLQMRRRRRGGDWEMPVNLACNDTGPAHNPAPFDVDGALHLLYGMDYTRYYHIYSTDGGQTFSEPEEITYVFEAFRERVDWHCIAVGPGGVCILQGGRIVAPVWLGGLVDPRKHAPAQVASIYSDDNGKTWRKGEVIDFFDAAPSEAQIVPTPEGALISLRNNSERRRRAFSRSPDGAHWEKPVFSEEIAEVNCQGSLMRLDDTLIVSGPEPVTDEAVARQMRENLLLRVSDDFGRTWSEGFSLEKGIAGYSALVPAGEGEFLCLYETWEDMRKMRLVLLPLSLDQIRKNNYASRL